MNVAVEGCCHGELDVIYAAVEHAQLTSGTTVDLLICCGDFQSVRNPGDLRCMAAPLKHLKMQTFYKYYSGEKKAPVLTLFIGGNHEASNYLQELPYGGWVAPNIYYLGYGGVINVGGLRIGGVSGIYKGIDYLKGKYERTPYTQSSIRSVYHVRNLEVFRMKQLDQSAGPLDIFLSHDWPRGVTKFGDEEKLCRLKPFFKDEVQSDMLGSKPAQELLHHLQPRFWFAGHLHVKFVAMVDHSQNVDSKNQNTDTKQVEEKPKDAQMARFTRFLALDKCLPRREFLHILKIKYGKLHKYQNVISEPSCDSQEILSKNNSNSPGKTGDAILPQTDPSNTDKTEETRSQTDPSITDKTGDAILPEIDPSNTDNPDKTGDIRSQTDPSGKTGDTRSPQTDPSNNNNNSPCKTENTKSPQTDGVPDTNLYLYSPFDESGCVQLHHDLEWLTVLRLTDHLLKVTPQPVYMPGPGHSERYDFTPTKEDLLETLRRMDNDLRIHPSQFCRTAQAFDPDRDALLIEHLDTVHMPEPAFNPYTQELCERLGIRDPMAELVKGAPGRSPQAARAAKGAALPAEADLTLDASRLTFTDEGSTSEGEVGGDIVFEVSICDNTDGTSQGLLSPVISPSRARTRQQPHGSPLVVSCKPAASDGDSDSAAAPADSAESLGQDSADTSSQSDAETVTESPSRPKRTSLCLSAPRHAVTDDVVDNDVAPAVATDVSNVETGIDKPLPKPTKIRRRNAALYSGTDE